MEAKITYVENVVNVPVFTVKFLDYDETTVLSSQQVHDWDKAVSPTTPTREWYTFKARSPAFSADAQVRADATYVATYDEDSAE